MFSDVYSPSLIFPSTSIFLLQCSPLVQRSNSIPVNRDIHYSFMLPTLSINEDSNNTALGKCYFNFTCATDNVEMDERIYVTDYTFFVDSSDAILELSANVDCPSGELKMAISFYITGTGVPLIPSKGK
jgi:hypothetical protein